MICFRPYSAYGLLGEYFHITQACDIVKNGNWRMGEMGEEDYEYDDGIFKYVSPAMVKACHNQMWPKNN